MILTIPAISRSKCILRKPCTITIELTDTYYRSTYIMYAIVPDEVSNEKNEPLNLPEEGVDRIFDIDVLMLKKHICKVTRFYYDKISKNKHAQDGEVFTTYHAVDIRNTGGTVDQVEFNTKKEAIDFFNTITTWIHES